MRSAEPYGPPEKSPTPTAAQEAGVGGSPLANGKPMLNFVPELNEGVEGDLVGRDADQFL